MSYHLPVWKRIPDFDINECNDEAKEYWNTVVLDADDKDHGNDDDKCSLDTVADAISDGIVVVEKRYEKSYEDGGDYKRHGDSEFWIYPDPW